MKLQNMKLKLSTYINKLIIDNNKNKKKFKISKKGDYNVAKKIFTTINNEKKLIKNLLNINLAEKLLKNYHINLKMII